MSTSWRFVKVVQILGLVAGLAAPACSGSDDDAATQGAAATAAPATSHRYNHLLVIHQTETPIDKAKVQTYALYRLSPGASPVVLAESKGFSGGNGTRTAGGFWFINIARRGKTAQRDGELAAFHDGIQEIESEGHQAFWGSKRANLSRIGREGREPRGPKGDTRYYLHGMKIHVEDPEEAYTWGCSADPSEKMLDAIFALDPASVSMNDTTGRLAVWVGPTTQDPPLAPGQVMQPAPGPPATTAPTEPERP